MTRTSIEPVEERFLARAYLAIGATFTAGLLVFAWRFSTYVGDDLSAFWLARTVSRGTYLTSLLGGQLVVLHRALTWLVYTVAPMRFWVALSVLGAFHAMGALFLHRTLESMKRSRINALLVAYYLMNVFVGLQLTWWSSGLTRLAYVAFALAAIHYYLAYVRDGRPRQLALVAGSYLLALGFYSKGVLIPLYCAAADFLLTGNGPAPGRRRFARWSLLAGLTAVGVVYVGVARSVLPSGWERLHLAPGFLAPFVLGCWEVLAASLVDRVLTPAEPAPVVALALLGAVAGYTVIHARASLRAWGALLLLVTVNFLFLGVSSRTLFFGDAVIFEYRHHFELWFLVVFFAGAALHRFDDASDGHWPKSHPRAVAIAAVTLLLAHGALSASALRELLAPARVTSEAPRSIDELELAFYRAMPESRAFLDNLQSDLQALARTGEPKPTFVDGPFPPSLDPMDFTFRWYSQLFVVLGSRARFPANPAEAEYRVNDEGHVVRAGAP